MVENDRASCVVGMQAHPNQGATPAAPMHFQVGSQGRYQFIVRKLLQSFTSHSFRAPMSLGKQHQHQHQHTKCSHQRRT